MIYNIEKKYAFVHIQKTGGISVSSILGEIQGSINTNQHDFISNLNHPENYFKFSFVRNPFDRLLSWYNMGVLNNKNHKITGYTNDFWKYLLENSNDFSSFLRCTDIVLEKCDHLIEPYNKSISFNQLDYISDIKGAVAVDFIGRFENIQDDFGEITKMLNINNKKLPLLNSFPHSDYRSYYNSKDVDYVSLLYKRDIEYFNYKFE